MIVLTPVIPFLPLADRLGFSPVPASLLLAIAAMYVVATELAKRWSHQPTA